MFIAFMTQLPRLRRRQIMPIAQARIRRENADVLTRLRLPLIFTAAALNGIVWAVLAGAVCVAFGQAASLHTVVWAVWAVTTALSLLIMRAIALASGASEDPQ